MNAWNAAPRMRSCIGVSAEAGTGLVDFFMFPKNQLAMVLIRTVRLWVPLGTCQLCTEVLMSVQSSRSTGVTKTDRSRTPKEAWLIVALLFLFMLINFADKAVIGIAAVPIMEDLQLSPRQFGLLGSSFYLLFSVSAIVTGFIVNRVETRWALLVMGLVWALTQFPMIGTVGFATLVACRIALVAQGAGIGIMVALPLLNWVIVHYSWHWAFGVLGIAGLTWTAAWLALGREGPLTAEAAAAARATTRERAPERIAYGKLLLSPTILACWAANFGAYWGLSQALSWQGAFLIKGLGLAQGSIGLLGALPAGASVAAMIAAGWYSQRLLTRGVSSRVARGILGGGGVALGGVALALMPYVPGIPAKIALATLGIA